MDRFGLLGYPIGHSLSPKLFEAAYGGEYYYDLIEESSFEDAFRRFLDGPYRAVNVTAPFKHEAAGAALLPSAEVKKLGAANILLKSPEGLQAFNSDYLGIRLWLEGMREYHSVAVIGGGGAGKAALLAASDSGFETRLYHHDEIARGVCADIIIFTLPRLSPGCDRLCCDILFEANYRDPVLKNHRGYVRGEIWLLAQAETGYRLMTGKNPDCDAMKRIIL